jgi:hypothetical protein
MHPACLRKSETLRLAVHTFVSPILTNSYDRVSIVGDVMTDCGFLIAVCRFQVRMFVDGKEMLDNAEIVHEWPIFSSTSRVESSLLIIGAAPHG